MPENVYHQTMKSKTSSIIRTTSRNARRRRFGFNNFICFTLMVHDHERDKHQHRADPVQRTCILALQYDLANEG